MKFGIKKIVLVAILTALMVVFSLYATINLYGVKLTLQNLPLFIAAITLGTRAGTFVGFMGSFVNQLLTYGFSATTLIWVLPHTIVGMLLGLVFEKKLVKVENKTKFCICVIVFMILLTILNTIAMYVDSLAFGYYSFVAIFGTFIIRVMISTIIGIVYCAILPVIIKMIKKIH